MHKISKNLAAPGMGEGVDLISELRPYLRHCGDSLRSAWRMETRCLTDYLLVYIRYGDGKFDIAGDTWNTQSHDLFWIPPNTLHRMEGFGPEMHCVYAHFDLIYRYPTSHYDFTIPGGMTDLREFEALIHPPVDDLRIKGLPTCIRAYNNQRVGDLLRRLVRTATHSQPYSQLLTSGILTEIVAEILLGQRHKTTTGSHTVEIERAANVAAQDYHLPVTVEDMIHVTDLSPSQFRILFKQHYDCSPGDYLRKCRIDKACDFMRSTNASISQIALNVGYANIHAFSKAFRKVMGISPTEYRTFGISAIRNEVRKPDYSH